MVTEERVPRELLSKLLTPQEWRAIPLRDRLIERICYLQVEVQLIADEIASEGLAPGVWMAARLDRIADGAVSLRAELAAGRKPGRWMEEKLDDIYTASDSLLLRIGAMKLPLGERIRNARKTFTRSWRRFMSRFIRQKPFGPKGAA